VTLQTDPCGIHQPPVLAVVACGAVHAVGQRRAVGSGKNKINIMVSVKYDVFRDNKG
jgi:hypothetical protein